MLPLPTARVLQGAGEAALSPRELTPGGGVSPSPDDGRVELAGVKVDETEGDGDGELPRHGEGDGQGVDVLGESRKEVGKMKKRLKETEANIRYATSARRSTYRRQHDDEHASDAGQEQGRGARLLPADPVHQEAADHVGGKLHGAWREPITAARARTRG